MNSFISGNNSNMGQNFGQFGQFANNGYGNTFGNGSYYYDPAQYLADMGDFISRHRYALSAILLSIPLVIIGIVGFTKKNYKLGGVSFSLLFTIFVLMGAVAFRTGKPIQYILLIFLMLLQLGLIIYFLTKMGRKVSNGMYLDFYTPETLGSDTPQALSYYDLGGVNNELIKDLMSGTNYGFALKEDMPIDLGAESTYSFWLKICPDNFNKANTNWKTVWFRGDATTQDIYKMKTPGVYLAPNTNKMIITVACENGPDEGNAIVLDDIPLNTWFCTTIVLDGRSLDCYINGLLEKSISLTGMPMMMNNNLVKGKNGFNGLLAFFRYSSGSLDPHYIKKMYEREKYTLESSDYELETC